MLTKFIFSFPTRVEHELVEMLDHKSGPCNEDPTYQKDDCAIGEIEKFVLKKYGCTPPFFENKGKICNNETISKQVWTYWNSKKYHTNCPDPCKVMLIRSSWIEYKFHEDSIVRLHFRHRVKVVKSYYTYSGLTLIAEIGGYIAP